MTNEQRKLCWDLVVTPPSGVSRISKEEFLRRFPSSIEHGRLAPRLLEDAYKAQNAEDLQCVLTIGFTFGFGIWHMDILRRLIDVDWHYSHEDVVTALEGWGSPDAVEALFRATQWIPTSLEYDENRALAVKAIWALGEIAGSEAEKKLELLSHSGDPILRANAAEQLKRRHEST